MNAMTARDAATPHEKAVVAVFNRIIAAIGDTATVDETAGALLTALGFVISISGDDAQSRRHSLGRCVQALTDAVEHNIFVLEEKPAGAVLN